MLFTVSRLPARTLIFLRGGSSGATASVALSARSCPMSLPDSLAGFGTSTTEPIVGCMLGGMAFASRITAGVVLNLAAIVSMRSRVAVTLCAVQLDNAWDHFDKFSLNFSALICGSRIRVLGLPVITGLLNCGFKALNSSIGISAS